MTKTLADMTPEERADCVGMWCDNLVSTADNPHPVVLSCVQGERCWILHTDLHGEWSCFSLGSVAPRFDLPRAWMPDGQPELAQALAEEAYFYGVQVWMGGRWIMMLTRDHGTSLMHRGKWFERKDEAQACAAKWNHDTPTRIVRQRRSPVEEISD